MSDEILNRVQRSGVVTIDFEELLQNQKIESFDLTPHLWEGLALKEKDFRAALAETNWETFSNALVSVYCSANAIIPTWAYMLVASQLASVNATAFFGTEDTTIEEKINHLILTLQETDYQDKRIVIKGCGNLPLSPGVYMRLIAKLQPVAKAIMFGEPCSTVPVYRKKR